MSAFTDSLKFVRQTEAKCRFMAAACERAANRANQIFIDASAAQMNAAMKGNKAQAHKHGILARRANLMVGVWEFEASVHRMGFGCSRCNGTGTIQHWYAPDSYDERPCPKCQVPDIEGLRQEEMDDRKAEMHMQRYG